MPQAENRFKHTLSQHEQQKKSQIFAAKYTCVAQNQILTVLP